MENIKIFVTSDLHGYLPEVKEPFDLLLICGDICPVHDHYYSWQLDWFMNDFADWINHLPLPTDPLRESFCKVVMTWGNHDFVGERINKDSLTEFYKKTNNRIIVLKNEEYNWEFLDSNGINILKIFGTPYCKIFGNWAFMVSNEKLKEKFSKIPENCDILISHDAPDINGLGMINSGFQSGVNAGNVILANAVREKKPYLSFCGHIHSGNHLLECVDDTWMANTSFVSESYYPWYDNSDMGFLKLELNPDTKKLVFKE